MIVDLGDEARLDPADALFRLRERFSIQWRRFGSGLLQGLKQRLRFFLGKAGADPASERQFVLFIEPEDQRSDAQASGG